MNEIHRYWLRLPGMNPEKRGDDLEAWFFGMLDSMYQEDPVGFAGMQFRAAMEGQRLAEERRRLTKNG